MAYANTYYMHTVRACGSRENRSDVGIRRNHVAVACTLGVYRTFVGHRGGFVCITDYNGSQAFPTFLSKLTVDTTSSYGGLNLVACRQIGADWLG